eukprot:gene20628-24773_t
METISCIGVKEIFTFVSSMLFTSLVAHYGEKREKEAKKLMKHMSNPYCCLKRMERLDYSTLAKDKGFPNEFNRRDIHINIHQLTLSVPVPVSEITKLRLLTGLSIDSIHEGFDFTQLIGHVSLTRLVIGHLGAFKYPAQSPNRLLEYLEAQISLTSLSVCNIINLKNQQARQSFKDRLASILVSKPSITKLWTPFVIKIPNTVTVVTLTTSIDLKLTLPALLEDKSLSIRYLRIICDTYRFAWNMFPISSSFTTIRFDYDGHMKNIHRYIPSLLQVPSIHTIIIDIDRELVDWLYPPAPELYLAGNSIKPKTKESKKQILDRLLTGIKPEDISTWDRSYSNWQKWRLSIALVSKEMFAFVSSMLLNGLKAHFGETKEKDSKELITHLVNPYCCLKRIERLDYGSLANDK